MGEEVWEREVPLGVQGFEGVLCEGEVGVGALGGGVGVAVGKS